VGVAPISRHSGDTLWALSAELAGLPQGHRVRVVVTRDDAAVRATLRRSLWETAGISLLAALTTALLGGVAARRMLGPVRDLSASAAALGPDQLGRRIALPAPGSELHGLVAAFNLALDRIESAFKQLETFNADVAHELRTPLNTLIGTTQVALARPRSAAELTAVLTDNLVDCERMATLVRDMLFLARADHGERAGERAGGLGSTSMRALAQDTAEFFAPLLQERGLTLCINGQAQACVDAGLIKRALSNLVANAIQYGDAGAPIAIDLSSTADGGCELVVSNVGPTLSAHTLAHMFDRFYRGDASRNGAGGPAGAGLGLAIVRAVAAMHGGAVFARNADGRVQVGMRLPGR
jgi:two-component system heavy metal sensor histidine kinase CusS